MAKFTEIYSFQLNREWGTECRTGQSFIQFLRGTDRVLNQNMFFRLGVG